MLNPAAYQRSIDLLKKAATPYGFVAALQEHDNYRRIWTRDGVITSLAALLSGENDLIATARRTIETLFEHQHPSGFMPSNVTPESQAVSYGGTAGRTDAPSWAVIGLCVYIRMTGDESLSRLYLPKVEKCFEVLDVWEFNGKHLVYVPQSGDWADEYIQHGYILLEQLLRVWALEEAYKIYGRQEWYNKAQIIRQIIRQNFYKQENTGAFYAPNLGHQLKEASSDYWLLGFNPARIYHYFDLQANTFALLLKLGTDVQDTTLLHWLKNQFEARQIFPSFYPTIQNNELDMRELKGNYAYEFRNKPHQFHNGGLWPVWNGWLAMALAQAGDKAMAETLTHAIHSANSLNNNEFNECLQGEDGNVCGVPFCTWSAAGAVIAEQALNGNFLIK